MGTRWNEDELDILRANYTDHGPSWEGWTGLLPGRTVPAIETKARDMGLKTRDCPAPEWTQEETDLLHRFPFRTDEWEGWRRILPGRSKSAIRLRRQTQGVTSCDDDRFDDALKRMVHGIADRTGLEPREVIQRLWALRFETTEEVGS